MKKIILNNVEDLDYKIKNSDIARLLQEDLGACVLSPTNDVKKLLNELILHKQSLHLRKAEISNNGVIQEFETTDEFEKGSAYHKIIERIEKIINREFIRIKKQDLLYKNAYKVDSASLQFYGQSKKGAEFGISPHRDQRAFVNLVIMFLIDGPSAFYICKGKTMEGAKLINAVPGDLIIMRGYLFGNMTSRPHHCVGKITPKNGRMTLGLRQVSDNPDDLDNLEKYEIRFIKPEDYKKDY